MKQVQVYSRREICEANMLISLHFHLFYFLICYLNIQTSSFNTLMTLLFWFYHPSYIMSFSPVSLLGLNLNDHKTKMMVTKNKTSARKLIKQNLYQHSKIIYNAETKVIKGGKPL